MTQLLKISFCAALAVFSMAPIAMPARADSTTTTTTAATATAPMRFYTPLTEDPPLDPAPDITYDSKRDATDLVGDDLVFPLDDNYSRTDIYSGYHVKISFYYSCPERTRKRPANVTVEIGENRLGDSQLSSELVFQYGGKKLDIKLKGGVDNRGSTSIGYYRGDVPTAAFEEMCRAKEVSFVLAKACETFTITPQFMPFLRTLGATIEPAPPVKVAPAKAPVAPKGKALVNSKKPVSANKPASATAIKKTKKPAGKTPAKPNPTA